MLEILIDYDNLLYIDKTRGVKNVVTRLMSTFSPHDTANKRNIRVRLYGGWYRSSRLSTSAQNLSAEIQSDFPTVLTIPSTLQNIVVKVELAFSSVMSPREHLFDTYRVRGYPTDLSCDDPVNHGCNDPNCPIKHVYHFITNGYCPNQCCNATPSDILYRGQQKLVDTLLAIDLFYLSISNSNPIVIVTSDDDFWPSIRAAIELETKVIHVHTKRSRRTPIIYSRYANAYYIENNLQEVI
jgi:uncharacterized LabA/DUF88 family protein